MRSDALGAWDGMGRDLEAVLSGEGELVREEVGKDENRGPYAGLPQLRTLLYRHDGQRASTGFESGAGDGDGAVTVGVGLYDSHEPGVRGAALEGADIVPDRAEVHLSPGTARSLRYAATCQAVLRGGVL